MTPNHNFNEKTLPKLMPTFRFSAKGGTLADLATHLTQDMLCEQIIVSAPDWRAD
jgi:hypothetical protein